jgi:hypothetical protein
MGKIIHLAWRWWSACVLLAVFALADNVATPRPKGVVLIRTCVKQKQRRLRRETNKRLTAIKREITERRGWAKATNEAKTSTEEPEEEIPISTYTYVGYVVVSFS